MPSEGVSASSVRTRVSTGYGRLDEALQGGFLAGSAIVLSAPASDEVPLLVRNFLRSTQGEGLLICRSLSVAQAISRLESDNLKVLICGESVPPSKNVISGRSVENLTEVNLQINETLKSVSSKRIALDILSEVLLRHKALQTRKWLSELLARIRSRGITILAILNPYMHAREDVEAIVDLFDGNLEIFEQNVEGMLKKFLRVKWMHGVEVAEKEFPLIDLAPQPQSQQVIAPTTSLKEPRWLTPLISRTEELSKLKAAFENALANKSSVVALQGEAGVGKTRLMQELAVYAQSKKAVVLSGSASEDGLPYAPWIEITRQYIAAAPVELLRRLSGPNSSELVKLVPDIAAKLGTIPPSKPLGEQQDKIRFYEGVTQFFIAICKDAPLLLLFDDMQYVDQASLDLLEYVVRSTSNLRVLTVSSVPAEHELESSNQLEQTIMKFNKQRLLETVTVKNLNKEETANLIKQVFGEQTVSSEFADLIYQRTGGNPFFVEEVLRSLVEDGTIFRTDKGWDRKPIQEIAIPKSVKNSLRSRLTKLDPETLSVLTTASIIGPEFGLDILREVTQTQEDTLLDRLERAITAGLVVEVPKRRDLFRFADSRIRDVLLDDIIQSRRIRHHVKIAEAMLKAYSKNLENQAEAIATHFSEGGDTDRGVRYSVMAGDRNQSIHAYEHAIKDYKRALDLIEREGDEDKEKALLLEKLGGASALAGKLEESIQCYERALNTLEKLNETKSCARVCLGLEDALFRRGARHDLIVVLERGLKYLEGQPESFESASLYSELAGMHAVMDEYDEAITWARKTVEVGEKTENFEAVATALSVQGSFLTDSGRIDEGLPLWEQALDKALRHEHYAAAFWALVNLSAYTYPRDLGRARKFIVQLLELAQRVNDIWWQGSARRHLSILDWHGGDWTSARQNIQELFEIKDRLGLGDTFAEPFYTRARLLFTIGDLEAAEADLQKALDVVKQVPKISDVVATHLGLGLLRLEQGRKDEARMHFETSVDAFKKMEFTTTPLDHIQTLLHLASIYAERHESEKARDSAQWARRLADQLKSDAGLAMALQAEAAVIISGGNRDGAIDAYQESLALWEKAGWPYYYAKALVAYSEAIAQTNPSESKTRLEQATEIFRKLGAQRDLEKAEAKLPK